MYWNNLEAYLKNSSYNSGVDNGCYNKLLDSNRLLIIGIFGKKIVDGNLLDVWKDLLKELKDYCKFF